MSAGGPVQCYAGSGSAPPDYYPERIATYVIVTCVMAACGGMIFGYDVGISGGVTSMPPFLEKFFPAVYQKEEIHHSTNQYCKFDSQILTLFTSSLYIAALAASCFAARVSRQHGRLFSILFGGLIFLAGAILSAAAVHISMLILGRILLGIGVGFASQAVPLYLSEMAPYKYRGLFNIQFQLMITFGVLAANIVNYFTTKISGGWGWRVSLGGAAVPALIISVSALFLSDTPNSLVERGREEEAKRLLKRIRGVENVEAELNDIMEASRLSQLVESPWQNLFFNRKYRPQLVLSLLIPMFQQLTGINVVMFYAPELFRTIGSSHNASLMSAVISGTVNVIATFVSIYGTDKWGRRTLFLEGGIQMLIFQVLVAALIGSQFGWSGNVAELPKWFAIGLLAAMCSFVAGFAWSWGPLAWLVPVELSPLEVRSAAQSVNVFVNMLFTFFVAQVFLKMLCTVKYWLFIFFASLLLLMTAFIYFFVPETKNIPIEEMYSRVLKNHWFWKRFVDEDGKSGGRPQA